jgi:hypothetical protein
MKRQVAKRTLAFKLTLLIQVVATVLFPRVTRNELTDGIVSLTHVLLQTRPTLDFPEFDGTLSDHQKESLKRAPPDRLVSDL